ncbi:hypothetical protein Trichorick_00502 [Candidatus Trichorickettsia mobilis]|uniref:Uncharacterized protein n=1 Tax=Candidatus Trichorickettsia mobilis TaxID=1346319 RepID=A0ABZ0URE4_9RICK|nr:hypothetical protein [Candidatus Trichorickettsia mobilis]WPY00619.1 hypothetical protein Trichorick_00502 [Candidatus Trichorickettsia mobilis]
MKALLFKLFNIKQEINLGISMPASANTMGIPGGNIMEGAFWIWK